MAPVADAILWLQRYGDNLILVGIALAGLALNVCYARNCPPGVVRSLKLLSSVALGYVVVIQSIYIAGYFPGNGWYEAATIALAATLALYAWVGRDRGTCV